jgi:hypothetical protein
MPGPVFSSGELNTDFATDGHLENFCKLKSLSFVATMAVRAAKSISHRVFFSTMAD